MPFKLLKRTLLLLTIVSLMTIGAFAGPIHLHVRSNNIAVVKQLLADGTDVNAKGSDGETPLHWAAAFDRKEIAELLIAKGADVNAKAEYGGTPLYIAASDGSKKVANLLITEGANVNAMDNHGKTPLDNAEKKRDWQPQEVKDARKEIATLLRKHGGKTGEELSIPDLVQHGRFAFSFNTVKGIVYEVQDSSNLKNWEVIKTYTGTGESIRFDEERDHDPPQWFYRVRIVE